MPSQLKQMCSLTYVIVYGDFERRTSNVRLRLKLPSDRSQSSAKHVSEDLKKSIFRQKELEEKINFDQKCLVCCNFRLILEELDEF